MYMCISLSLSIYIYIYIYIYIHIAVRVLCWGIYGGWALSGSQKCTGKGIYDDRA